MANKMLIFRKGMSFKQMLLFLFTCISIPIYGQPIKEICGQYVYYVPENIGLSQARQTALQRARITALADEFGTYIGQRNVTRIKNENGQSDLLFFSMGESEVRGEWLEDTKKPTFNIYYEKDMLRIEASICGKARKVESAQINFTTHILRNGTDLRFESDKFKDGDILYLMFQTPTNGYLSVYLINETNTASCLLPYRKMTNGIMAVKANQNYLLFCKDAAENATEKEFIDKYYLYSQKEEEVNFLYIIFSPNPFVKAVDQTKKFKDKKRELPRELSLDEFQKWLTKNRLRDKDIQTEIRSITISKK